MKAAFVKSLFQFEVRDISLRDITPDEVLVKIKACGVCGTDLHTARTEAKDFQPFGHEITGIAEKVGVNVKGIKVGDAVLIESGSYCGTCELCRNGRVDLCNKAPNVFTRAKEEGLTMGFAEYLIAYKQNVVPFSGMSFEAASLVEPMGVALDLIYTTRPELNDDVLVIGLGPIGLMALIMAKLMGTRHMFGAAHSTSKARIEMARKFGADDIIFTDKIDLTQYKFPRGGVDKIMITAPPRTIQDAIKVANIGGVIGFLGIEYGEGANITFDANYFHFRKLQLRASYAAPALWFPRCVELIKSGAIDASALITHKFRIDDIASAIKMVAEDKSSVIKAVMVD